MNAKFFALLTKRYGLYAIATLLILVLIAMVVWFSYDILSLGRQGTFRSARIPYGRHAPAAALKSTQIEGWMTFRYLNYVFNLPVNYLRGTLSITDSSYPNLSINAYADAHHLDRAAFTASVRQAVGAYANGVAP